MSHRPSRRLDRQRGGVPTIPDSLVWCLRNTYTFVALKLAWGEARRREELISRTARGGAGNASSDSPALSDDGRYVVFASDASNLVSGDNNASRDIFLRDRQSSITTRVSVSSLGAQADFDSDLPYISGDGRYITFLSGADNLVSGQQPCGERYQRG